MRLPKFLRTRRSLLAEIESLTLANRKLTEQRDTAEIVSWVRRNPDHSPKALVLPNSRSTPHVVHLGRHREPAPETEVHPRRSK